MVCSKANRLTEVNIKLITSILFIIQFGLQDIYSQLNDSIFDAINVNQHAPNFDNPGKYQQVISASKTIVAPGDKIEINYFVSGYGKIDNMTAKVYYAFSSDIVDSTRSSLKGSFKKFKNGQIGWGGSEFPLSSSGATLMLSPMIQHEIEGTFTTLFDDSPPNWIIPFGGEPFSIDYPVPLIYLEQQYSDLDTGEKRVPPYKWKIKLKENLSPGDYYVTFILTYFNGEKWENDKSDIKITIMPWYEQYNSSVQWITVIISFLTIVTLLNPAFIQIQNLLLYFRTKYNRILLKYNKKKLPSRKLFTVLSIGDSAIQRTFTFLILPCFINYKAY